MKRAFACLTMIAIGLGLAPGARADPSTNPEIDKLAAELKQHDRANNVLAQARVSRKLYEAQRKLSGDDSVYTRRREIELASLLMRTGEYSAAIRYYDDILMRDERQHGRDSRQAHDTIGWLIEAHASRGDHEQADALYQRLLAISKQINGEQNENYANDLLRYGLYLSMRQEYAAEQRLLEQALHIAETAKRDEGRYLPSLGLVYLQTQQPSRAIAMFDRYVAQSKARSIEQQVSTMYWVSERYRDAGRDDLAKSMARQAIELAEQEVARIEQANDPDARQLTRLLFSIGGMLADTGDLAGAERVFTRQIALAERRGGFPAYAQLATVQRTQHRPREALALFEQASAEIAKSSRGPRAMNSGLFPMMADIQRELGDYAGAEHRYLEAQADADKLFGKGSILAGRLQLGLVDVYVGAKQLDKAERALATNLEIAERELATVLAVGTEADHIAYFSREAYQLDTAICFHAALAPTRASVARLALTTLLRRKGRVLDASASSLATIRGKLSADDRQLLDQLGDARSTLSKLAVGGGPDGADRAKEIAALEDQIRKLEVLLGQRSTQYKIAHQPIDLDSVQRKIPRDAKLVEIVNYQPRAWNAPYEPKPTVPPRRYAAYVLGNRGAPSYVDLGPAQPIDDAVARFRAAIADPDNDRVTELGLALNDLTFARLAAALGSARHVLLAPDGALNLVPFAALFDGKQFLIKRYMFTYLTSGRDLLRSGVRSPAMAGTIIFADPDFDGPDPTDIAVATGRRSRAMAGLHWSRLPGTAKEAEAVLHTVTGSTVYRGASATETAIKAVHAPSVLHLATHGFFLDDAPGDGGPTENPLLRAGLVFAGANKLGSGADDGILTALEASGLDLWGTKLVVMSACETGVGKISNGDGVYGLRRALVIAGAESLVMSLWQVDDDATRDLMSGYYRKLQAGRGRSAALREVQLELQSNPRYAHPYYWASFIPAGDSSPLGT
jgi:CHAT domain-containing protein